MRIALKKIAFVLAATALALLAVGCRGGVPETPVTEAVTAAPLRTLISDGIGTDYAVVRPDVGASGYTLEISRRLQNEIEAATGVRPTLKTDWYADNNGSPPGPHEILLGDTNRAESEAVKAVWRPNGSRDWTVRLVGDAVVLYGTSEEALTAAVGHLLSQFLADGALAVPEGYEYTYEYPWTLSDVRLGGVSAAEYQIVVAGSADALTAAAAERVQRFLREAAGLELKVVTDAVSRKASEREIVIGETTRGTVSDAPVYAVQQDGRYYLGGADGIAVHAAVTAFLDGAADVAAGGVYTAPDNYRAERSDRLSAGVAAYDRLMTDRRAAAARRRVLDSFTTLMNRSDAELADADKYGNLAVPVLCMPANEVTEAQRAFANKMARKVAGYMTTDIPPSVQEKNGGNGPSGEVDFAAIRLVRVLYAPGENVEEATRERLRTFFLNDDFQSKYSSENHCLMERGARYLAAAYYREETFNQYRKTGAELMETDGAWLKEMMRALARQGYGEYDTFGYSGVVFLTFMNLYECAPDEEMRQLARMSMDVLLMNMLVDSTPSGMYGGAHGRSYNLTGTLARGIYWTWYLYFGGDPADFTGAASVENTMAYVSDYRPHDIVYAIAADRAFPYTNRERSHMITQKNDRAARGWNYGSLNRMTYNTALYSIGCVQQNEKQTDEPLLEDVQATNWLLAFAENPKALILTHHPGDTNFHNYWYGDSYCNCAHLFGHESTVIGIYHIPGHAGSFNFIHAYLDRTQFDEVIENEDGILVRLGDAYARLRFSDVYAWSTERPTTEVVVRDGAARVSDLRIAFVCEAGSKDEYGSFAAFCAAMANKEMVFDRDTLRLRYGAMELKIDYSKKQTSIHQYLDGKEMTYPYEYTYDSPSMRALWDSGVVEMFYGGAVRTLDFEHVTDETR